MSAPLTVRTTCPYCGVGCGIAATVEADGTVAIAGDADHPANFGRLCSKGSTLGETLSLDDRLLYPEIGGARASWDQALDLVAEKFGTAIRDHGPNSVAFYVSGQLLTEDYYVANKLMKGFIGSANIDTNSRLCMASSVAGHRRAFGADIVPGCYEDLEEADLIVMVGSNLAWCHPILFRRINDARAKRGTRLAVIDPRRTATADDADMHLAVAPDSDVALFNGLLSHLAAGGFADATFVAAHTSGLADALAAARATDLVGTAAATGLAADDLVRFYDLFAAHERVVTIFSQGVNQSTSGTDKVNAIINCHLITGRIARPGMGPFSVTGQPNAMGGREVGGLANQLAAHMNLGDACDRAVVQDFWRSPRIAERAGLKAVDLFAALGKGKIKALWVMGTNPADSLPGADGATEALAAASFVVVSDVIRRTDTTLCAGVLLPAAAWGEKDGTVTNSERRISRQRAFLPLPGEAKPDWAIVCAVAKRMGWGDAFAYDGPADIFREYAALTATANDGRRGLDLGGLARLSRSQYEALAPVQWPVRAGVASPRLFADGRFFTEDGRARFVAVSAPPAPAPDAAFPLILNTGRVRDHWHTMTRTGKSARLAAHVAEPFVEIHPGDAAARGLEPAGLAEIASPHGRVVVRVRITDTVRPGTVFLPMHWTDQFASAGRVNRLVGDATDPHSGQPGLKFAPVEVRPYRAAWHGFAVLRARPERIAADYWAIARAKGGWRIELGGAAMPGNWTDWVMALIAGAKAAAPELLAYHDTASEQHRFAAFDGDLLRGAIFIARKPVAVARAFAASALEADYGAPSDRLRVLAGRPGADRSDNGPIVCTCFEIGFNQIADAVLNRACASVDAVGALLKAGTNCGSCRSEIQRIVHDRAAQKAV